MAVEKRTIRNDDSTRAAKKALVRRDSSFKISKGQARAAANGKRARRVS